MIEIRLAIEFSILSACLALIREEGSLLESGDGEVEKISFALIMREEGSLLESGDGEMEVKSPIRREEGSLFESVDKSIEATSLSLIKREDGSLFESEDGDTGTTSTDLRHKRRSILAGIGEAIMVDVEAKSPRKTGTLNFMIVFVVYEYVS